MVNITKIYFYFTKLAKNWLIGDQKFRHDTFLTSTSYACSLPGIHPNYRKPTVTRNPQCSLVLSSQARPRVPSL